MRLKAIEALEEVEGMTNLPVAPTSVKAMETEVVLYAHVGNIEGLEQFDVKEEHIQLEDSFSEGTRCRVRKTTTADGQEEYVFTYKLKSEATDGGDLVSACIENNAPVDKNFFEGFEKIAKRRIEKTRYTFNSKSVKMSVRGGDDQVTEVEIPNVQYEVDIFHGTPRDDGVWCKIDVEVDNILAFLAKEYPTIKDISLKLKVSHLPFQPDNILLASSEDENVQAKIKGLWDTFLKPTAEVVETVPTSIDDQATLTPEEPLKEEKSEEPEQPSETPSETEE